MTTGRVRIPDRLIHRHPDAVTPPGCHTDIEIATLIMLLRDAGVRRTVIGHGRHCTWIAAAAAVNAAWTQAGGIIEQIVSWPTDAASRLRPAKRLVAGGPQAWVIADNPAGWAQMAARLVVCLANG